MCMPTPTNISGFGYSWGFSSTAELTKEVETPSSMSYTLGNTVSPETTLTVMSHKIPQSKDQTGTRVTTSTAVPSRRAMFIVNESQAGSQRTTQQTHTIQTSNGTVTRPSYRVVQVIPDNSETTLVKASSNDGRTDNTYTDQFVVGPIQLTAEECNEILMKRALQAQGIATPVIDASQLNHTILNGTLKQLTEQGDNGQQTMTIQHHFVNTKQEPGTGSSSPKEMYNTKECAMNTGVKERPYACEECGKSFLLKHHLTTHARVHTGERPHVCVHCGKAFAHKHCLNTHLLLHSTDRPYQCHECKKSFTLKHHLLTHSRVHSRDRPFVCSECGRGFPLKRHLVTHTKYHAGERPYICPDCGESFSQKDHLVMHSRFHGSTNPFVCSDCGVSFARKFQLVAHGRVHGRVPHQCPVCAKEFLQKRTLVAHMKLHTGEGVVACLECGEAFKSKLELQNHAKITRHGIPQTITTNVATSNANNTTHNVTQAKHEEFKPQIVQVFVREQEIESSGSVLEKSTPAYGCTECGSCFNTKEALALHVRLHAGDRTCVTDLAALTAALQPGLLPQHNNTGAGQGLHIISTQQPNVVHTQVIAQNPVAASPRPKIHFCADCGKGFAAKHGLQQHNRRHPDGGCTLRTHVCDTCGKAFFQKNHLLLHQRQHMDLPSRQSQSSQQQQQQQSQQQTLDIETSDHQQTHIQVVTNRSGQVIGNQIVVGGSPGRRLVNQQQQQVHIIGRDGKTIGTQQIKEQRDQKEVTVVSSVGGSLVLAPRNNIIKYEILPSPAHLD